MSAPHHNRHGHHHGDDHEHSDGHRHAQQAGIRALLASVFTPHSHHPVGAVDTALATSEQGLRALRISLAALVTTAVAQLAVVMVSGSVALLADTVHNFADALTAVPLGVAFWLGRRPSTRRYTYGYGRAEDLAGIVIVATVALSAVVAAWQAVDRLVHPRAAHNVGWVIAAGVIGAIGNELVADGLHARTDGLTSLAVVLGAIGVAAGAQVADPIVGLVITVAILLVLNDAARDIYRRLVDSVEPGLVDAVERILTDVSGVEAVEAVRIRWVGHQLRAEAAITSDADLSLADAHAIAEEAHHRLLHEIPGWPGGR